MSELADALKKIKKRSVKENISINTSLDFSLNYNTAAVIILISFIIISLLYLLYRGYSIKSSMNYKVLDVAKFETSFLSAESDYAKFKKAPLEEDFFNAVMSDNLSYAFMLAKQSDKSKLLGIYNFKIGDYPLSKELLSRYLSSSPKDEDTLNTLANISYIEGKFDEALSFTNRIESDLYYQNINKAVLYEATGNIPKSLELYKATLPQINNPIIKFKIFVKIFVLDRLINKNNLKVQNEHKSN